MIPPQRLFLDPTPEPTLALLKKELGRRFSYWKEFSEHVPGPIVVQWKYYGKKMGWTMKLLLKERNLCFISAYPGYFAVAFVFGDKAVASVEKSTLPAELVRELVQARRYAEGRGIQIEVKSRRSLEYAKALIDIKRAS